jgi:thiamine kinase-like enzyme
LVLWLPQPDRSLILVDYEYAGFNYRGFDIANHYCEWAMDTQGPDPALLDFSRFPSLEQQRAFCRAYIEGPAPGAEATEQEVAGLMAEAQALVMGSHLFWGVWGLLQSRISTIHFNFLMYAKQRLAQYRLLKAAAVAR